MRTHEPVKLKEVSYSYPTSPNAIKFGYAKCGCYTVSLRWKDGEGRWLSRELAGHATKDQARAYGEALPYLWSKTTL